MRIGCVQAGDEVKLEIMDCLESLANKLMNGRSTPSGKRHPEALACEIVHRFGDLKIICYRNFFVFCRRVLTEN